MRYDFGMPRRDPVRESVESVALAARDPESAASIALFRQALRGRHNLPAARAAQAAAEHQIETLVPDLTRSFSYFMSDASRRDPRCAAKIAIAEALDRLDFDDSAPFLEGLRHVQMEKTWGGAVDTAAPLRARSVAALVRLNHPDRYRFLADLLFDPRPEARRGAVHAAAFAGGDAAEMLLRIKVQMGDEDLSIVGDCLSALLQLAPEASVSFVGRRLQSPEPQLRGFAALALGEGRAPGGLDLLRDATLGVAHEAEFRTLALAIGLYRTDEAFDVLLELLEKKPRPLASATLETLALYRHDRDRWQRVTEIAESRGLRTPE
jgi:hypothetical protein